MSRIFRSEAVRPGDRVVVRRRRGEHASDVIGHVVSTNPLVIRPQEVGGLPSSAAAIEITEPHIVRRLSPRTVRNSDIRAIETASARAFCGSEQLLIDGWLARSSPEAAALPNSATPIGHSAGFAPVPIGAIAEFYRSRNKPVRLLIPERIGKPALKLVDADPRWSLGEEILVMTADMASRAAAATTAAPSNPAAAHAASHADTTAAPATATAGARASLTESDDGRAWLGIAGVGEGEGGRRQAIGARELESLLAWGAGAGAQRAYLHVEASNEAAVALYEKLGFVEHHRHRYARLG